MGWGNFLNIPLRQYDGALMAEEEAVSTASGQHIS